ncbi:flavohemoglobin expression-modulating QEGLA motif protein [Roseimaritima ulvae]|uniref:Flavohemoglobin expression-modulating QEGLA motif protein n=1 Tax=Roseimaritima ulvae TaxID=980254 RepID=A0A5B9QVM5_9BACT|nr:tyrosine/phenylalanine carboxypeptidase domain-containing protein [Roseimaritima ulvae]QEG42012.1 hypothetical protein UC8_40410 [Roseimaritima ulvae]
MNVPTTPGLAGFKSIAAAVARRLAKNRRVRRNLPGEGRLRIDRQLPFLCVYRSPAGDDVGTRELVTSEAAYLYASGERRYHDGVEKLCQQVSDTLREHFGTFLLIELWSQPDAAVDATSPDFEIVGSELSSLPATVDGFRSALEEITIEDRSATVAVREVDTVVPPGRLPLNLSCESATSAGCVTIGIAVRPMYRSPESGELYPMVLQALRSQLAWALRKAISRFSGATVAGAVSHYHTLGPTALVKAVRRVDQQLSEVSEAFDFLLQVTPTNADQAWQDFKTSGFASEPMFVYRPLPYRISLLKRQLFEIEIERIEDPTLAHLFWEKQDEVDCELTALRHLDTPNFLHSSRQLYGDADEDLQDLAKSILQRAADRTAPSSPEPSIKATDAVPAETLLRQARDEIDYYHQRLSEFNATVEICDHIASGIMVSQDRLLIANSVRLPPSRVEPLLHHEIGTHLLTYFNGRIQPFRQLYAGLAGYEELQEGLAVLAEYLTGGLTAGRLCGLAGRVLAAASMTAGASFCETFALLHQSHSLPARKSFVTTLRAYRGGGMTKDVIYLRGLRDLLAYLARGHDLEPLYAGKFGLQHLPYVQEMRRRGIVRAPGVLPRFWNHPGARERLEACRRLSVVELLEQ